MERVPPSASRKRGSAKTQWDQHVTTELPAFLIFRNLRLYFEYRGLDYTDNFTAVCRDTFAENLSRYGHIGVKALDPVRKNRVLVEILAEGGKQSRHSPQLRELLTGASMSAEEVILIVDDAFFTKKNEDVINDYRKAHPEIYYRSYPFSTFSLNVPEHESVPRHRLVEKKDVMAILNRERLSLHDLAPISARDPPVAWLGGVPGQVVEIERLSETALTSFFYRIIT